MTNPTSRVLSDKLHVYQHPPEAQKLRSEIRSLEVKISNMRAIIRRMSRTIGTLRKREKALIDDELRKCMQPEPKQ